MKKRKNKKTFPKNILKIHFLCRRIDTLFDICQRRWNEINKLDKENDDLRKKNLELNKKLFNAKGKILLMELKKIK